MNRLSSPSIVMESQMNGNFGENSSSSSSNSSSVAFPTQNSSSDTSKPYKPKFHNYKKLDLSKTSPLVMPSSVMVSCATSMTTQSSSTPSTPSTPSFFSANAGNLVSFLVIKSDVIIYLLFAPLVDASNHRGAYQQNNK